MMCGATIITSVAATSTSSTTELSLELRVIGLNFLYAILGVVLMVVSYRIIDIMTPSIDFQAELRNGNIAVAIFIAALFLAIAIIIGGALN
jgi:uncharacterized membrane protein YjfL (UPF0719 family)